jgi:hypothetical protein
MRQVLVIVYLLLLVGPSAAAQSGIRGAWKPELYVLRDGTELSVTGLIYFAEADWSVLFFVLDDEGEARRGSGEGGTYRLDGDRLEFTHLYHLSAGEAIASLPEAPLAMHVRTPSEASREPCRVEIDRATMTIFFPSGNQMRFRRP